MLSRITGKASAVATPTIPPLVIVKDGREPDIEAGDVPEALFRPWVFAPCQRKDTPFAERERVYVPLVRGTIDAGDYAPQGLEGVVSIERKSGVDLLATLTGRAENDSNGEGRQRLEVFRAELERARKLAAFCIVCEVSTGWLFTEAKRRWERYGKSFDPFRILELVDSFAVNYACETVWAGSKSLAEREVGWRLARVWDEHHGGAAWKKAEKRGYAATLQWAPPSHLHHRAPVAAGPADAVGCG